MDNALNWLAGMPAAVKMIGGLVLLLVVGIFADVVVKRYVTRLARRASQRTRVEWDDDLIRFNVVGRLTQAVPALIIYFGVPLLPGLGETFSELIRNVALAYVVLVVTLGIGAFLSAVNAIYNRHPAAKERPIKGFVQIAKIAIYILGAVLAISALMAKSPVVLLTGLGAMTAILLLIFRDTILSLVASVQLASLDMVRVGDWIEMPQFSADGDVIDVALHTVKVQNWDKTITTIPTHKLISESFRNWRGMSESGGRRIKRSINIDVNSVCFLTDGEIERFRDFAMLRGYIDRKRAELQEHNVALGKTANVNLRRLTNLGTFRAYVYNYLKEHPRIHKGMTLMVRQLQPAPEGIPIEIYCFTDTTEWAEYESVQADIFDHLLAQCREFGLKVFQSPSGADIRLLHDSKSN